MYEQQQWRPVGTLVLAATVGGVGVGLSGCASADAGLAAAVEHCELEYTAVESGADGYASLTELITAEPDPTTVTNEQAACLLTFLDAPENVVVVVEDGRTTAVPGIATQEWSKGSSTFTMDYSLLEGNNGNGRIDIIQRPTDDSG